MNPIDKEQRAASHVLNDKEQGSASHEMEEQSTASHDEMQVDQEEAARKAASMKEQDVQQWAGKIGDYDQQQLYVQEGFWGKVKRYAGKVPFAKEVVTLYYCATDPATPMKAKATAIGALAYWILPLDLIPDFVPVVGFADDATAVLIAYKAISNQITDAHREKAEQFFILNRNFKLVKRAEQ